MPRSPDRTQRASPDSASGSHDRGHALPSVEFTFSYGSPSPGRMTPTSSQDETIDSGLDDPERQSTAPITRSLFENLRLDDTPEEDSNEADSTTRDNVTSSRLTPRHPATTYRDLHNVSPSPNARSDDRSEQQPRTPTSPSASRSGTILPELEYLTLGDNEYTERAIHNDEDIETEGSYRSDDETGDEDYLYNIRQEELPRVPIYNLQLQSALREVKRRLTDLAEAMQNSELAHDHDTALHQIYQQCLEASRFQYPETRTVGFIGDSGVGKSTLINSLLDRRDLARSSGDGAACTTVVTEFRNIDEQHPEQYTVEADYMNAEEIKILLEELLRSFRAFYTPAFAEISNHSEQEEVKSAAVRAGDTLKSLFPSHPELDNEFLAQGEVEAEERILRDLQNWATDVLEHRPGGLGADTYSAVAHNPEDCKRRLDELTKSPSEGSRPAIWPFVKLIRVYLNSPILRTGLVLADVPGFRDLNHARVMATERYLRHDCDEVFVVSNIIRCTTDPSIEDIIRRCVDDQPIRIVCTRSEDVDANQAARSAPEVSGRIREFTDQIEGIKRSIGRIRRKIPRASGREQERLRAEKNDLMENKEEVKFRLKHFLMARRNTQVTGTLSRQYHNRAQVFCVSNTLYTTFREEDRDQAQEYIALSGIPNLRRCCQSVPAEAQMRATESYLENQVPALLGSMAQWTQARSDTVTVERAERIRGILTEAERSLHMHLTSSRSQIRRLEEDVKSQFDNRIIREIRRFRHDWRSGAVQASRDWESWHHTSYAAFCRRYGTHQTTAVGFRCWNEEILRPGCERLTQEWEQVMGQLEDRTDDLEERVSSVFITICDSISENSHLAPDSLGTLLVNIDARKRCIIDAIHTFAENLNNETERIKLDATLAHTSSYIGEVMRPIYDKCQAIYGPGCDRERKQAMYDHLSTSRMFTDYSTKIKGDHHTMAQRVFDPFYRTIQNEVGNITRDLRSSIVVEGEITEADRSPALTERLRDRVVGLQEYLPDAQTAVRRARQATVA